MIRTLGVHSLGLKSDRIARACVVCLMALQASAGEACEVSRLPEGYIDSTMQEHRSFVLKYLMPALHTGDLETLLADQSYRMMSSDADAINDRMVRIIGAQLQASEAERRATCNYAELARRLRDVRRLLQTLQNAEAVTPADLRDFNQRSMRYLSFIDACQTKQKE